MRHQRSLAAGGSDGGRDSFVLTPSVSIIKSWTVLYLDAHHVLTL